MSKDFGSKRGGEGGKRRTRGSRATCGVSTSASDSGSFGEGERGNFGGVVVSFGVFFWGRGGKVGGGVLKEEFFLRGGVFLRRERRRGGRMGVGPFGSNGTVAFQAIFGGGFGGGFGIEGHRGGRSSSLGFELGG